MAALVSALPACHACAKVPERTDGGDPVEEARVRAHVPGLVEAKVTRDRAIVTARGALDPEAPLEAASIAKLVIAVVVQQLVEEAKADLDEDVARQLEFAVAHPSGEAITLRRLLTHRASVLDRTNELAAPRRAALGDVLRDYFASPAPSFRDDPPGTRTEYSNAGAALAAHAVERIERAPFDAVAERRVFRPLRMTRSSFRAPEDAARPHVYADGGFVALPLASHAVYPVVDLFSTAGDLARFARAILRGGELDGVRVLREASVTAMLAPDVGDSEQALAWQLRTIGGTRVAGHEGEDRGASTALFLDRDAGVGAVLLANGDAFASDDSARASALTGRLRELLAGARVSSSDAH